MQYHWVSVLCVHCSILTLLRIITYYNTLYCIITIEKALYS